jgi:hypothetical protein
MSDMKLQFETPSQNSALKMFTLLTQSNRSHLKTGESIDDDTRIGLKIRPITLLACIFIVDNVP